LNVLRGRLTVITDRDGGGVGYQVPPYFVDASVDHFESFEQQIAQSGVELRKTKEPTRVVRCVRRVKYTKEVIPKSSTDYREDGEKPMRWIVLGNGSLSILIEECLKILVDLILTRGRNGRETLDRIYHQCRK